LKQLLFEALDESGTSSAVEVESGHDDDLIQVETRVTLPNTARGKLSLVGSEAAEPDQEPSFEFVE
jgi:hypothetical protein